MRLDHKNVRLKLFAKGWGQLVHPLSLETEVELAQEATIRKFRMVREKEQQAGSVAVMEIMTGEASK